MKYILYKPSNGCKYIFEMTPNKERCIWSYSGFTSDWEDRHYTTSTYDYIQTEITKEEAFLIML